MTQQNTFGLEVSRGFVAKLVLAAVGFAGSVVFARYLGPAAYGAFHVVVAAANVLDNPLTGFGEACKKRISERDVNREEIVGAGLSVALGGGALIAVSVAVAGPYVNPSVIDDIYRYIGLVLFSIALFKLVQPMIDGTGGFGTSVMLDALRSILTIPLQLVLVFLGWGVAGMVYGLSVASLLSVPVALVVLGVRPTFPTRETIGSLWSFAKFSIPKGFVGSAYHRVDILLLGIVLGSGAAGQYQIAYQLVLPGAFLAQIMGSGLFSEVSSLVSRQESTEQRITNNTAFASLFAVPILFGSLAMPNGLVVTVFGPKYRPAGILLVGLALYQLLATQSGQVSAVLSGYDRPDLNLTITTITLVTNVVLGLVLVYHLGAPGIVVATVFAEATKYGLLNYYARQFATYELVPQPLRYQFLAGFAMFLVVEPLHGWWGIRSALDLAGLVGVGAVVYAAVLLVLSDLLFVTVRGILRDASERYL